MLNLQRAGFRGLEAARSGTLGRREMIVGMPQQVKSMAGNTRHRPTEARGSRRSDESQHSHFEYGSTHGNWDRDAARDFAITTVNVPDRLDTQELRARAAAEDSAPSVSRFHLADKARVVRWLLALALLGGLAWGAWRVVAPLRAAISPMGVESQIGAVLGVPVSVRDTELHYYPAPRLVVTDLLAQGGLRLPQLVIYFNWRDAMRGLQSAKWVLGEAHIAPVKLTGPDALSLLQSVRRASELPAAVSVIRFESVEFPDIALLPGRHQVVIRRGLDQREFNAVSLKQLDAAGTVDIEVTPPRTPGGSAGFVLFATKWTAPAGPAITWNEATARGEFQANAIKVDSYSVGSSFGNMNGAAQLVADGRTWTLTGNVRGVDIAVEDLLSFVAGGRGKADAGRTQAPLRGTANVDLTASGSGSSVEEALQGAGVRGRVTIPGATIYGVNLGLAATQGDPGGSGSATRFTDLEVEVSGSSRGLSLRNISGKAGSLRVSGAVDVDRQLNLSGSLRTEVLSPRGVASAQTRVGGTVAAPAFK